MHIITFMVTTGKSLFSQHYLETRLPAHPEWGEDPGAAYATVRTLWQKAQQLGAAWNEAQTEDEFVKPALAVLGWHYIPQAKNRRSGRINRPDYALFADQVSKDATYPHQGNDDAFYSRALAIAEAKYWDRPLSLKDSDGRDTWKTGNNPSHQMVSYLVGTRCPWGILTNGQVWRLYSREVSSTASEYYEFDLDTVFGPAAGDDATAAFKRWWLIFRRAAFVPDTQGRAFIQRVLEGSTTYAREISDKLKELVFDEVMPEIARGFVSYRRQQLGIRDESDESLHQIYQASLSLLYKLLFLLYAEARSLLPVQNPAYWEESLTHMAQQFAARFDRGQVISDATHATRQYDALLALFRRIDQGDPSLGIPRYDGGLFNPASADNQFLVQHKLSDRAVARAVDILVRDAGQPVDYAYISVRNLGSIYEGLLENRLRVLGDGGQGLGVGVELVNDKGERKATGSYYTPDYIVNYIVQQTLTPILAARQADFGAAMGRVVEVRRQLEKTANPGTASVLRQQLEAAERQAREAFLGIKVCDPAMGSGHFLVNAVDHITDGIIQRMQTYHDQHPDVPWAWNPLQRLVERVRQDILTELDRQGIGVDPARLDDTALLTRLVMKRCIYGVDLNPMAVELAKLSLWLHSFTIGAPLSFLDHHLRWGNSLVGSDVRTVERAIRQTDTGQLGLFGGPFAGLLDLTSTMLQIAARADSTLADVQRSAGEFAAFQAALTPYKQVLDVWVSQYFGNRPAGELLTLHGDQALAAVKDQAAVGEPYRTAVARARALWQEKRFFHWDLEFPEVFVDLDRRDWAENPGFDGVIGNPPYVRQEQLKPLKPYFQANFLTYHAAADLYLYFYEHGIRRLNQSGYLAYISSGTFARGKFAAAFRQLLPTIAQVQTIIDFGENQPFEGAEMVRPSIMVLCRGTQESSFRSLLISGPIPGSLDRALVEQGQDCDSSSLERSEWVFQSTNVASIARKIINTGSQLIDAMNGQIHRGLTTGLNDLFIVDDSTRNQLYGNNTTYKAITKPAVQGQDLRPWYQESEGRWMIVLPAGWTKATFGTGLSEDLAWREVSAAFPGLAQHVLPYADAARKRYDKGDYWWELRACDYYDAFDRPKIFWPDIAKLPRFSWDDTGKYINNTGYIMPSEDHALLGILQSRVIWFAISQICQPLRLRAGLWQYRVLPQFAGRLPIPEMPDQHRDIVSHLALEITQHSTKRYTLHRQTRHRILTDLGTPDRRLNQKLNAWWDLDFSAFRREIATVFKRDIALKQRDEWEAWLAGQRATHARLTAEIVHLETELNARVYTLFDLTPAEIQVIEQSTKYRYGEV